MRYLVKFHFSVDSGNAVLAVLSLVLDFEDRVKQYNGRLKRAYAIKSGQVIAVSLNWLFRYLRVEDHRGRTVRLALGR